MNRRERFLIILLAAVAILLGGFKLLIEPELNLLNKAMADNAAVSADWIASQNNSALADSAAESNAALEERTREAATAFFPEIKPDNLQVFFSDLATQSGVIFTSYVTTAPAPAQVTTPSSPQTGITYPAKEAASDLLGEKAKGSSGAGGAKGKNTSSKDQVEMVVVSLQYTSAYGQTLAFLQAVRDSGRMMRVSSLAISGDGGRLSTSVSVECFGLKKLSADSFSDDTLGTPPGKENPFS